MDKKCLLFSRKVKLFFLYTFINFYFLRKSFVEHQMKTKWCDLFILGLIQCADQFDLTKMLHLINENFFNLCSKYNFKYLIKNKKNF